MLRIIVDCLTYPNTLVPKFHALLVNLNWPFCTGLSPVVQTINTLSHDVDSFFEIVVKWSFNIKMFSDGWHTRLETRVNRFFLCLHFVGDGRTKLVRGGTCIRWHCRSISGSGVYKSSRISPFTLCVFFRILTLLVPTLGRNIRTIALLRLNFSKYRILFIFVKENEMQQAKAINQTLFQCNFPIQKFLLLSP